MIANLGDSRAVLGTMTEDGEICAVQLTSDLTPDVPSIYSTLYLCLKNGCNIRGLMILIEQVLPSQVKQRGLGRAEVAFTQ